MKFAGYKDNYVTMVKNEKKPKRLINTSIFKNQKIKKKKFA